MADKKKPPPLEDEAQSKRFIEAVRQIEAAGGLSQEEAERAFEDLAARVSPAHQKRPEEPGD